MSNLEYYKVVTITQRNQIYRCNVCGNIVEVVHPGRGILVCCSQPMQLLEENRLGEGKEKHVPIIERTEGGVSVKVGAVEHPMQESHYIEWIEVEVEGATFRKFLKPGDKPEAFFPVTAEVVRARAYCNVHGLWST